MHRRRTELRLDGALRFGLLAAGALSLVACGDGGGGSTDDGSVSADASADAATDRDDAGSGDAGSSPDDGGFSGECTGACGTPGCGSCPEVAMVEVTTPDGESYEVDATEVTNAQYAAFLGADPPLDLDDRCGWDVSHRPHPESSFPGAPCEDWSFDPEGEPDMPVVCIDWCDAVSYCRWAGKRLCGKVGGGFLLSTGYSDPNLDQWYNACSAGGALVYPYGDTYEPATCVGYDYDGMEGYQRDSDALQPVQSAVRCHGAEPPFNGLFDLSGNAWEWTDVCESGLSPESRCLSRGGSFTMSEMSVRCDHDGAKRERDHASAELGFRCCRD